MEAMKLTSKTTEPLLKVQYSLTFKLAGALKYLCSRMNRVESRMHRQQQFSLSLFGFILE